jgi:hypothetical protein
MRKIIYGELPILFLTACMPSPTFQVAAIPGTTYPFVVEKSVATAEFKAKTYDEVWGAVVKALLVKKYRLTVSEKEAGIIQVTRERSDATKLLLSRNAEEAKMSVVLEKIEDGVSVILRWQYGEEIMLQSVSSKLKKVYGEFYQAVADILYEKKI